MLFWKWIFTELYKHCYIKHILKNWRNYWHKTWKSLNRILPVLFLYLHISYFSVLYCKHKLAIWEQGKINKSPTVLNKTCIRCLMRVTEHLEDFFFFLACPFCYLYSHWAIPWFPNSFIDFSGITCDKMTYAKILKTIFHFLNHSSVNN